jgi:amidase
MPSKLSDPAIHYLSVGEIARAVATGHLSAVEVVTAHLARIDAVNPQLNALVKIDRDQALASAVEADARVRNGQALGPLHGVPFTVKDVIDLAGVIGAAGIPERCHLVAATDAVVVARLKAAGAIAIGKTNCPPGGGGGETDNPVYGRTSNPHDLHRSPGGSSGGEAAAVAAGLSAFGVGSDSGGSLRVPAHFCGVVTLKPTVGRVPHTGVFNHPGGLSDVRSQIGIVARTVRDVELVWPLLAGPDGCDSGVIPMPLPPVGAVTGDRANSMNLRGLKVALYSDDGIATPSTETVATVNAAGRALSRAGASVESARPPDLDQAWTITRRYWAMDELTGREVQQLFADWDLFRSRQLAFMADFDAIVCPADATTAPLQGVVPPLLFSYSLPSSLCGWPGAVVRAGTDRAGLPIGVQIIARPWHEHIALALAARVESVLGGWQAPHGV